jgi:hypothetical protein
MHSKQAEMVDLPDGSKCDRRKVAYNLRQNPGDARVFHAVDRQYIKQPDGSLRRVGRKMTREDRKEEKRIKREMKRRAN